MTLNQILYFRKVARLENYHQAAEELYISQPSLSRSMAALESELGITLFEKKGRGVVLTNAGRLFLEHAEAIAEDLAAMFAAGYSWEADPETLFPLLRERGKKAEEKMFAATGGVHRNMRPRHHRRRCPYQMDNPHGQYRSERER